MSFLEIQTSVLSVAYQVILQTGVRRRNQKKCGGVIIVIARLPLALAVLFMRNHARKPQKQVSAIDADVKDITRQTAMLQSIRRDMNSKNGIIP